MPEAASPKPAAPVGLVLDPIFARHDPGPGHPEQIARYEAITARLTEKGLTSSCKTITPREATDAELTLIHSADYIKLATREIEGGATQLSTGDTAVCAESLTVARHAAGAVCETVDAVLRGDIKRGFCVVRPPGHHATPAQGMGFCIYNNAALAARHAQQHDAVNRVAIVDWDVHHGNGTQDIFYRDATVHFFSTHQWPLYPGTGAREESGAGPGKGCTLNRPYPAGSGMKEIGAAFEQEWQSAMNEFKPDLIVISAGFDSRVDDPLGQFTLTDTDFASLTGIVRQVADRFAQGRVISCLEGGYNVKGLALAAEAHLRALLA